MSGPTRSRTPRWNSMHPWSVRNGTSPKGTPNSFSATGSLVSNGDVSRPPPMRCSMRLNASAVGFHPRPAKGPASKRRWRCCVWATDVNYLPSSSAVGSGRLCWILLNERLRRRPCSSMAERRSRSVTIPSMSRKSPVQRSNTSGSFWDISKARWNCLCSNDPSKRRLWEVGRLGGAF
jgi:hypothetical protein